MANKFQRNSQAVKDIMAEKDGNWPRNRVFMQGNRARTNVVDYRDNYDRIFGKKKLPHGIERKPRENALVGPLVKD